NFPTAVYIPTSSTAAAARDLANDAGDHVAAVCPELAAERYGLEIVADDIGDRQDAVTRFVVVTRPGTIPAPTGADKTTVVAALRSDRAGSLLELLEQFSSRGINMSRIESRPTGNGLGLYQFSIDLLGHIHEARMAEALQGVHRAALKLSFLGSYPSADGEPVPIDPTTTDESFSAAADWLEHTLNDLAAARCAASRPRRLSCRRPRGEPVPRRICDTGLYWQVTAYVSDRLEAFGHRRRTNAGSCAGDSDRGDGDAFQWQRSPGQRSVVRRPGPHQPRRDHRRRRTRRARRRA